MQHGGKFEFFEDLINLLHSWSIFRLSLERWHVGVIGDSGIGLIVLVDAETELDHPVDAPRVHGGVLKAEAKLRREVSKSKRTRSFTDLSFLSVSARCLRFSTMLWSGLISRCFLAAM